VQELVETPATNPGGGELGVVAYPQMASEREAGERRRCQKSGPDNQLAEAGNWKRAVRVKHSAPPDKPWPESSVPAHGVRSGLVKWDGSIYWKLGRRKTCENNAVGRRTGRLLPKIEELFGRKSWASEFQEPFEKPAYIRRYSAPVSFLYALFMPEPAPWKPTILGFADESFTRSFGELVFIIWSAEVQISSLPAGVLPTTGQPEKYEASVVLAYTSSTRPQDRFPSTSKA